MKYNHFYLGLSIFILNACNDNLTIVPTDETIIRGNICKQAYSSTDNKITSETLVPLPVNSQILLNASGNFTIQNQVFTYSGDQWVSSTPLHWTDSEEETSITALCPVWDDYVYTYENLYQENELEDILYVKENFPAGKEITLQFKHLFSMLTFHVSEELQKDLQEIEVTTPLTVSSVSPTSLIISFNQEKAHTTSLSVNTSQEYNFIIPPVENLSLTLAVKTCDKTWIKQLDPQTFTSNCRYEYNLKTMEELPGISTPEDLIAFSLLINNEIYKGNKTLKDFGDTANGITTYRLLNDITLTAEESAQIIPIGKSSACDFEDIFDGQGHTLYNFIINPTKGGGLFGFIAPTGSVKNLNIDGASFTSTGSQKTAAGLLVKHSDGELINCHIKNSTIITKASTDTPTGAMAGMALETAINCSAESCTINAGANYAGGMFGQTSGQIINCYSANNNITGSSYKGGICGKSNTGYPTAIINCYIKSPQASSNNFGAFLGAASTATVTHSFYESGYRPFVNEGKATNIYSFNTDFITSESLSVLNLLNEWVKDNSSLYPQTILLQWEKGNDKDIPAIFIKPQK